MAACDGAIAADDVALEQGTDLLLMKRSEAIYIAPVLWAGIGGHREADETRDPLACVLREGVDTNAWADGGRHAALGPAQRGHAQADVTGKPLHFAAILSGRAD